MPKTSCFNFLLTPEEILWVTQVESDRKITQVGLIEYRVFNGYPGTGGSVVHCRERKKCLNDVLRDYVVLNKGHISLDKLVASLWQACL